MFVKEAINGNVIPVHNQSVRTFVLVPSDTVAMIGPPDPGMIYADVVAVNHHATGRRTFRRTTHPEKKIKKEDGLFRMILAGIGFAHLQQFIRIQFAGIEQESAHRYMIHIRDFDDGIPVCRDQSGHTQAHHYGAGLVDLEGFMDWIDSRGKKQILTCFQGCIDRNGIICRCNQIKTTQAQNFDIFGLIHPTNSAAVFLQFWNSNAEIPVIKNQVGFFADYRCFIDNGIWICRPFVGRSAMGSHKHHVPASTFPCSQFYIPRKPLLLRTGINGPVNL